MLVLFETPAGLALFKVLDEGKIKDASSLAPQFSTPERAQDMVSLHAFEKFDNTTEALAAAASINESKVGKSMKRLLKHGKVKKSKEKLIISDGKLAKEINEKFKVKCLSGHEDAVNELMRGIRLQVASLVDGLSDSDLNTMALGLSHSLSRYKLKFSADKVDTMIVQAISLLDDLDKELNTYAMRVKEWYGWHFPELQKILPDNLLYAKTIKMIGIRSKATDADLEQIMPEEIAEEVKEAAVVSMGTEISDNDVLHIMALCDEVIEMMEYRDELYDYLKSRMQAVAPNLTAMVGELVGARLISHSGSLMALAKHPASTVQILGAEKALFRALKTKHATPKYGLIYHASLIGQATPRNKGKMSRVLANKCSLAIRVDALGDKDTPLIGPENREKVENRLRQLEGRELKQLSGRASTMDDTPKYDPHQSTPGKSRESKQYNTDADQVMDMDDSSDEEEEVPKKEKKKKGKKEKKEKKKQKGKKRKRVEVEEEEEEVEEDVKRKKKKGKKKKKKKSSD